MGAEPFVHRIRPRYAEVDMQGVVFNAHWLTYFDDAMTQFVEALGFDTRETFLGDWDCMVVKAVVEWQGSAGWEEEIAIAVAPARLGNASFDLRFEASVGERPACTATITYVSMLRGTRASTPIPEELRARMEHRLG